LEFSQPTWRNTLLPAGRAIVIFCLRDTQIVLLGSSGAAFVYVAPDMQGVGGSLLTGAFRGLWPWLEMAGGMHLMLCTPNLLHRIDRPNSLRSAAVLGMSARAGSVTRQPKAKRGRRTSAAPAVALEGGSDDQRAGAAVRWAAEALGAVEMRSTAEAAGIVGFRPGRGSLVKATSKLWSGLGGDADGEAAWTLLIDSVPAGKKPPVWRGDHDGDDADGDNLAAMAAAIAGSNEVLWLSALTRYM